MTFWIFLFGLSIWAALCWYSGYRKSGHLHALLMGNAAVFLSMVFLSRVVASDTTITYVEVLSRTGLTVGILHILMAADAYAASRNNHFSLVTRIMRPIERAWERNFDKERARTN